MRRGKKPTRKQKIRLGQAGLAPENWLVVKQKANGDASAMPSSVHSQDSS